MSVLNAAQQQEIRTLTAEADAISQRTGKLTDQEKTRFNFILSRISAIKNGAQVDTRSQAELQAEAAKVLEAATGKIVPPVQTVTGETRHIERENEALRNYLCTGFFEKRTYSGMNLSTDTSGGFLVPQSFYDKLSSTLKQVDRLFDDSVVTVWESDHGNSASVPVINDTESAVLISENATSVEDEPTVDRLLFGKTGTYRSKKIIWSMELLQDSSFDALTTISNAVALRYARGIGAANVTTLLSQASSAATTTGVSTVSVDELLALLGSIDPAYISSPKCFWAMNFNTLIGLFKLSSSTGEKMIRPWMDSAGNWLLFEKPIAICPSFANIGASAKPIAFGDFSKFIVRRVKGSTTLKRYSQAPSLGENGLVAFEGFTRSSAGLLVASGADSPIKYLTCAAS